VVTSRAATSVFSCHRAALLILKAYQRFFDREEPDERLLVLEPSDEDHSEPSPLEAFPL
jgi:hypothetical protein